MRLILLLAALWLPGPLSAQVELASVSQLLEEGKYVRAEELLLQLVAESPLPEYKNRLGEVYGLQEKWDKAIEIYRELSLMYPENADYHFRYGGVLAKKAQNSNIFIGLSLLGGIKSSFRKAMAINPSHIDAHWAAVDLYVSLPGIAGGSLSKAHQLAMDLKKLSAADGYLALGYVYEYDNEPQLARENYLKALNLLKDRSNLDKNRLNYQLGKISAEYGVEMERGVRHLTQYINKYTVLDGVPLKWAYYRLATIYRKKADRSNAKFWIEKTLAEDPTMKLALKEKTIIENL